MTNTKNSNDPTANSSALPAALSAIHQLGTVGQLNQLSRNGHAPSPKPKANSHIHLPPNFSAFDSIDQAISLAAEQAVRILGLGNYYDFTVYESFAEQARKQNIFPLFGLEIISLLDDLLAEGRAR